MKSTILLLIFPGIVAITPTAFSVVPPTDSPTVTGIVAGSFSGVFDEACLQISTMYAQCKQASPCYDHAAVCDPQTGAYLVPFADTCATADPCAPCFTGSKCSGNYDPNWTPPPTTPAPVNSTTPAPVTAPVADVSGVFDEACLQISTVYAECKQASPCYDHAAGCDPQTGAYFVPFADTCAPADPCAPCFTGSKCSGNYDPNWTPTAAPTEAPITPTNSPPTPYPTADCCDHDDWWGNGPWPTWAPTTRAPTPKGVDIDPNFDDKECPLDSISAENNYWRCARMGLSACFSSDAVARGWCVNGKLSGDCETAEVCWPCYAATFPNSPCAAGAGVGPTEETSSSPERIDRSMSVSGLILVLTIGLQN